MMQDYVSIPTSDGKKLKGLLRKPGGSGLFPVVVFVTGLGMTMHEWDGSFDEIAKKLVDAGFMTVQFDFDIFHGDRVIELPIFTRAKRVQDVIAWIKTLPDVDSNHVCIIAQSYGVITTLASNLRDITSLVFVSGAYFPKKSIAQVYKEKGVTINYSGDTSLPRSSGENTTVTKEFWTDVEKFNDIEYAKKIHQPILVIHGTSDNKIPVDDAQKVFAALSSKVKQIKIFENFGHGVSAVPQKKQENYYSEIVNWFTKTLS